MKALWLLFIPALALGQVVGRSSFYVSPVTAAAANDTLQYVSKVDSAFGGVASGTLSITTTAGTGNLLIFHAAIYRYSGDGDSIANVTCDGSAFTKYAVLHGANARRTEIWYFKAPTAGANSIVITGSGSLSACVSFWKGVNQTTPLTGVQTEVDAATNASIDITSSAGEYVIDAWEVSTVDLTGFTVGGGQTQISAKVNASYYPGLFVSYRKHPVTAMAWTFSEGKNYAVITARIQPQ